MFFISWLRSFVIAAVIIAVADHPPVGAQTPDIAFSLDPLPRDHLILQIDPSARGALLEISGTANPGTLIEARYPGIPGSAGAWHPIANAGQDGFWSGTLRPLPAADGFVTPQIRADGRVRAATRVAAGHIVAIWGQSEFHRAVLPHHAASKHAPEILDQDTLQITYSVSADDDYGQIGNFRHDRVTPDRPITAYMAILSNVFSQAAPHAKFHLIFHTRAGTGFQHVLSDANPKRTWQDDVALARFAMPYGQVPSLAWMSWYASDTGLSERYGDVLFAALTGRNADGSALRRGDVPFGGVLPMDHYLTDLYGPTTNWVVAGPHRFERPAVSHQIAAARASVNEMFLSADLPTYIRRGVEPLTYLNGNPSWQGDYMHPNTTDRAHDGMGRLIKIMGNSILRNLGLLNWHIPELDRAELSADHREISVWSRAGSLSTTRLARSGLATGIVEGFWINGQPARHATIENGRILLRFDADGTPFPPGSRITFGSGGIGAHHPERDVSIREIWQDYPIVDVGQTGLEGMPVKAQTPARILDIIPADEMHSPQSPPGNLLNVAMSKFKQTRKGWRADPEDWTFDPVRGTATAGLTSRGALQAVTRKGAVSPRDGSTALSFFTDQTGSDPERLRILVTATGGGATLLLDTEVTITPGRRMSFVLPVMPANRSRLNIVFNRRGAATGHLTLGQIALTRLR